MVKKGKSRIRFRISIILANILIVLFLTAVIISIVLSASLRSARENANILFTQVGTLAQEKISTYMNSLLNFASIGSVIPDAAEKITGNGISHPALPFMRECLDEESILYSVYYGRDDGTFLQLISARGNALILAAHKAPEETVYILRSIENVPDERIQHWTFLDSKWNSIGSRVESNPDYDPRKRPWYISSTSSDASLLSEAYIFNSLKQLGITGSKKLESNDGVFGVDMTLDDLNTFVEEETPSPNGGILLLDQQERLLAGTKSLATRFQVDFIPLSSVHPNITKLLTSGNPMDGKEYLNFRTTWDDGKNNIIHIIVLSPLKDFTGYLVIMQWRIIIFSLILLTVVIISSFFIFRKLTTILTSLAIDAERVKNLDFAGEIPVSSVFLEFHQLADGFHQMKHTISERTEALDTALQKLEKIVDLGIAMAVEHDVNRLAELILEGAKSLANADGGSLYLKGSDEVLDFIIVLNDSLGFVQGGTSGVPVSFSSVPIFNKDGTPNHKNVVTHAFHTGETINIEDAYNISLFDFSGTRSFDEKNQYKSHSFLTVPLRPRGGDVMGALQLINAKDKGEGSIIGFSTEIQRFVEALAAAAATSLYNRDLLETQQKLFDSMIHFTAGAIDAKSHYTGGHCERVPQIAIKLAEIANQVQDGYLGDFKIKTAEEWREFKVAAWLHDCGKMTTPEYVVDKATKLETIHNRIHEVRTRFEVFLRDAEIDKLQSIIDGTDPETADRQFTKRKAELRKDFTFIAECNSGDKSMEQEDIELLKKIGARKWIRNFDDTLGLSWAEQDRLIYKEAGKLPCEEPLIADKPEHLILRTEDSRARYAPYGFTLPIPEYLYNRGELYNLCVKRGTLNQEERFKINEHVIQTIVMLENLPLPASMKRVPHYAGTHHETLKGTGYPRGLDHMRLSVPARIMAIADIFEALTASDRPYKRTKPLSQCIKILHSFKKEGDIDPELFNLFLTSGIYLQYAKQYMKPEQIDEVDIAEFI